jgi:hypothetical protein
MPHRTLDEDVVFEMLGNHRRRECLKYLDTAEPPVDVRELAQHVAEAVEADHDPELERSIYTTLCQTHLPRLDERGIVDYDSSGRRVSTGPAFDAIRPHIDESSEWSVSPGLSGVLLAISLLSVALLSGDLLVSSVFGRVSVILLNLLFIGALVARHLRQ